MKARVRVANPHAARASGDRWLFGYADIVTLLLAVFASLYAAETAAPEAAGGGSDTPVAVDISAAGNPSTSPAPAAVESVELVGHAADEALPSAPDIRAAPPESAASDAVVAPAAAVEPLDSLVAAFSDVTGEADALPGLEVISSSRGVVISLPEAGSFPPGSADLSPRAVQVMADLAERLRDLPNLIRVEGHTDDVPIATDRFASNWDLSTARATRVVALLIDHGLAPGRLAAAGYGEHRPRRPNVDPASRARNRRVDIVVLDPATAASEDPGETLP